MSNVFSTALSGLNAATARLLNASVNVVNLSSTGKVAGANGEKTTAYEPTDVISLSADSGNDAIGVTTKTVARNPSTYNVYDPSSPDANTDGMIAAPNVDLAQEAVTMIEAKLSYEANAKIIGVAQDMQQKLLDEIS